MNPLKNPEDPDEATRVINQYAASDWLTLSYSKHGEERREQRYVSPEIVLLTLKTGTVRSIRSEVLNGRLLFSYEVVMRDRYGRVTVVTAIPGPMRLRIVTTYTEMPD